MNEKIHIPIVVTFVIVTFLIVVSIMSSRLPQEAAHQLKMATITSHVGGLIAVLSAILLLFRAASGVGFRRLLPLTIPLLAGALIREFHWGLGVTLGCIVIAIILREIFGTPGERFHGPSHLRREEPKE